MARYADIDKLKEMVEAKAGTLIEGKEAFLYVAKWLELLPAADVVPRDEVAKIFEEIERNIFILETPYQPLHCIPSGFIEELREKYTKGGEGE